MKKYDVFESLPLIAAVTVFILLKSFNPFCVGSTNCLGVTIAIVSLIGALGSFIIYKWSLINGSLISYYRDSQVKRLKIGTGLWLFLLCTVLVDMFIFKIR